MKYRIVYEDGVYYVQTRNWWWPFWSTDEHYIHYDKPKEVMNYGGFLGNIGYKDTEHGYWTSRYWHRRAAEIRILELKRQRRNSRKKTRSVREVVHVE
jgi:hypothetical protein